jgi:hypothetical protein
MLKSKKDKNGSFIEPKVDSSSIYTKRMLSNMDMANRSSGELKEIFTREWKKNAFDLERQSRKGNPGYDKNGFRIGELPKAKTPVGKVAVTIKDKIKKFGESVKKSSPIKKTLIKVKSK